MGSDRGFRFGPGVGDAVCCVTLAPRFPDTSGGHVAAQSVQRVGPVGSWSALELGMHSFFEMVDECPLSGLRHDATRQLIDTGFEIEFQLDGCPWCDQVGGDDHLPRFSGYDERVRIFSGVYHGEFETAALPPRIASFSPST